jgi:butyryl-CoA dehydrogenase
VLNLANLARGAGLLDGLPDESSGEAAFEDDPITLAILIEELALGEGSLALIIAHRYLCRRAIQLLGMAQTAALEKLKGRGDSFPAVLLWPPMDQSERAERAERAERERTSTIEDGRLRAVSGSSLVCSKVSAVLGSAALGAGHRSAFYFVDLDPGRFQFEPRSRLGLQASPIGELSVEKRLDRADLVIEFEDDDRHRDFWRDLISERKLLSAATLIGVARAAFEYALDYSKERTAFGKPISQHQAVGLKLADMAIAIEAARLMIWRAAEPEAGRLAPELVEDAWLYAKEVSIEIALDALQVLGGHGYLKLHPVERRLRDVQTLRLLF